MAKQNNNPSVKPPKESLEEVATKVVSMLDAPGQPSDPVEAAKGALVGVEPPAGPQGQESGPPPEEPKLPEPPKAKAKPVPTAPVFVVQNGPITVNWGAQELRLRTGDEITEDSYGDGAIARMRERGVEFKEKV